MGTETLLLFVIFEPASDLEDLEISRCSLEISTS